MKTYLAKKSEITADWYCVDASGQVLGRLAAQVSRLLMGKHKPIYTPHLDTGDHVVVINADKVMFSGKKREQKVYYRHTGYPGGLKSITAKKLMQQKPEAAVRLAVRGMLPKNTLGRQMFKKLKVYAGANHPHQAQQPIALESVDKQR